jgi:phosphoglycerol transferase
MSSLMTNSPTNETTCTRYLVVGMAIILGALLVRNTGLYPFVFSDEYVYSTYSRLQPSAESHYPDYLYLAIYSVTTICGEGFLSGARMLNALFFVAAGPFLYLVARRACSRGMALAIALLSLAGPINTCTVYYMPESVYFLSFWLITWFLLRQDDSTGTRAWSLAGVLLGLASLIKPHALLLVPAIVAYVLYVSRTPERRWLLRAMKNAAVLVIVMLLTKMSVGYLLAGERGLSLFGTVYTSIASSAASGSRRYLEQLAMLRVPIKGHVLAMCLMFGLPIVIAINNSLQSVFSKPDRQSDQVMSVYAIAIMVDMWAVAGIHSVVTCHIEPYETLMRLHMRYYNFMFPLFLMIAASVLASPPTAITRRWRGITALPIGAAIIYAACTRLVPYTPWLIDCPELNGFTHQPMVFYILSGTSLFTLVLWGYSAKMGARVFICLFVPLGVFFSDIYVNRQLRSHIVPQVYDRAGICARQCLPSEDLSKLVVVGSELAGLYKTLFNLDNPQATLELIPSGADCDAARIGSDRKWVLVIGDHGLPKNVLLELPMSGFTLACIRSDDALDFRKSTWPGAIARVSGLSWNEAWGTWSIGSTVTLDWVTPLPKKFKVRLVADAFGPNIGKQFVIRVGDCAVKFTLGPSPETRELKLCNPNQSRIMKIEIPSPISPKQLGIGDDDRILGIGLVKLKIVPEKD